ncbi:MAG: leucine zipper domain-containing protein [bacterium]|nr:leucine zipper domain-containing protein [bacterium]
MQVVKLLQADWSTRQVARYLGFNQSAIVRWSKRTPDDQYLTIPTKSSKPHNHPKALKSEIIQTIIRQRLKHGRCAEVVYQELLNQGVKVSLSSVKRTLDKRGLIKKEVLGKDITKILNVLDLKKLGI